ncbi:MAG: SPASM domain-containing protein, partial [Candidatus Margulisbacteria bacterium]|nr:SPASM domain-containing protein [Candidatus Margulisiibacteriota bacterium]
AELPLFILNFKKYFYKIKISLLNVNSANSDLSYFSRVSLANGYLSIPCPGPFTNLHILANGDISCCLRDHFRAGLILGNISEMTLLEAWQSKKLLAIRKSLLTSNIKDRPAQCRTCYNPNLWLLSDLNKLVEFVRLGLLVPEKLPEKIKILTRKYNKKARGIYERL